MMLSGVLFISLWKITANEAQKACLSSVSGRRKPAHSIARLNNLLSWKQQHTTATKQGNKETRKQGNLETWKLVSWETCFLGNQQPGKPGNLQPCFLGNWLTVHISYGLVNY